VVTTRRVARVNGARRLVRRAENCTPIQTGCQGDCGNGPEGENGGGGGGGGGHTSTSSSGDHPGLDDNTGVSFGSGTDDADCGCGGDEGGADGSSGSESGNGGSPP